MAAALAAFETWSRTPMEERVSVIVRASEIIRANKYEFCAWLTFEVGKNWVEAEADVAECIDSDARGRCAIGAVGSKWT